MQVLSASVEMTLTPTAASAAKSDDFFTFGGQEHDACTVSNSCGHELTEYLGSSHHEKEIQVILKYPLLREAFLKYNAPVPSSASVERLFSVAGDVLRRKRGKLCHETFEIQLLLRANKAFW